MDFMELVRKRQSVRTYRPDPIPRETILQCLEAARLAPSASNSQPWKFIVVDDPELVREVAAATISGPVRFNKFAAAAPVIVIAVKEPSKAIASVGGAVRKTPYGYIDIGAAVEHFCLAAAELGIGTCILGWLVDRKIMRLLSIPSGRKIAVAVTVGYPANEKLLPKVRKPIERIVSFNGYGGPGPDTRQNPEGGA